jgi:large subunit ribosomal protein L32
MIFSSCYLNDFYLFSNTVMALPKQRHTRHRRDRARKQYDVALQNTATCPKCSARVITHRACGECGFYKGMEVIKKTAPKLKKVAA